MTKNKFLLAVYGIEENRSIRLNHVTLIHNKMIELLWIYSKSNALIQNNTLTKNDISSTVYDSQESSTIELNHVTIVRNMMFRLLWIS